uniref:Uncharacterized protein MANES_14G127600 n=1 Tax=Rhizophora mucronata TaxID=61149 RepID=A0A2P2JAA9_RHIMU
MTVDDENSIYVGWLSHGSANEETLRRVFGLYGAIVAVKIINDRGTRGKCYAFVTFRNPRSVTEAINDMNGKAIDGRIVRVNGVTTRGGRSNFNREHFQHNQERAMDWDRGRDRERAYGRDREWNEERFGDRSRERDRSLGHEEDRGRGYGHGNGHDQARDGFLDGDQARDRDPAGNEQEKGRNTDWNFESNDDLDWNHNREMDGTNSSHNIVDKDTDQNSRKHSGSNNNRRGREVLSDSSDDYSHGVKEQLEKSMQRLDELKEEIAEINERMESKQNLVSDLQNKAKKLEDALITAKRLSSQRKMQLTKLHKCFLQVKEYTDRLKSSEHELQVSLLLNLFCMCNLVSRV